MRRMRGKAKKRPQEEWIIVPGTHEAIIDPETWDRVQDILRLRTRTIDFEQNVSIFAGFLKCADCGRAMVKRQYTDRAGKKRWFYTCGAYSRSGTEVCSNHYIRHEILEQIILDDLNTVINSVSDIKSLIENQWSERPDYGKRQEKEAESVKKRIQKLERLKKESYLDYKENLLSREEYLDLREDYLRQEQSLKIKLEKLLCTESEEPEKMLNSPWVQSLLIHQEIDRLDRDMMVEFVEKIEIGEKNEDNQQEITIHYRFSDELDNLFQMVYTGSE
ncbi:MAG: recombinase zinc beta ribbon domain-containing protein [Lachnospiraceae bacterium]|nr:recombinase zinc beta ribbon domain-containing protein [Lachnospiraceae bacterium]